MQGSNVVTCKYIGRHFVMQLKAVRAIFEMCGVVQ